MLDVKPEPRRAEPPVTITFAALPRIRLAEPFEKLRDASDRALAKTGARPKIFLANLGTPAEFNARATFAKNFFEAGGIEADRPTTASPRDDAMSQRHSRRPARKRRVPVFLGRGLRRAQPSPPPTR